MVVKCPVCSSVLESCFFVGGVMNKYEVEYYLCHNCEFLFANNPFWLEFAYSDAITCIDLGLVSRNIEFSGFMQKLILDKFDTNGMFLDYGGGYGLFVRMMRDKGYNFYIYDEYCENIFAKYFDVANLSNSIVCYELITCFEVVEHIQYPIELFNLLFSKTSNIVFSTELRTYQSVSDIKKWEYLAPEFGQHISFYSLKTLEYIADLFGVNFYSDGLLHVFSKFLDENPFKVKNKLWQRVINSRATDKKESLLMKDYYYVKSRLENEDII